jgi:soluble lytic murein transglycosylase-like protein
LSLADVIARIEQLLPQPQQAQVAPTATTTTSTDFSAALAQARSGATSASASQYQPEIDAAAQQNGLDPALLSSVIQQESGFDPNATSSAGAQGLMQLMPSTAASLGVTNPYDPSQSIEAGARYLRSDLDRVGGNVPLALAAYNAGLGAVEQHGGVPPYAETQNYVQQVMDRYQQTTNEETTTA